MSEELKLVKKRFFVDRTTGHPVTRDEFELKKTLNAHRSWLPAICVTTHLANEPDFYIALKGQEGIMLVISDGEKTLYMWMGNETAQFPKVQRTLPVSCKSLQAASANFIRLSNEPVHGSGAAMGALKICLRNMVSRPVLCTFTK